MMAPAQVADVGDGDAAGMAMNGTGFARGVEPVLLDAARAGDRAAQGQLYQRFADAMYRLALRTLGCAAEAEEVVHDAFLAALKGLAGYRGDAPFGLWLRKITAREAVRRARQTPPRGESIDAALLIRAEPTLSAEQWELERALARLPRLSRTVVWLHLVEGYGHEDIGELFGRSESFSKSQVSRSLVRLRELMQQTELR
jgi:RNA polymerase sigma-70 factor (ECF subfamily)